MNEQPHPERVRLLPWRIPWWVTDTALVGLMTFGLIGRRFVDNAADGTIEWVATAVAVVVILGRRRYPIPALGLGLVTTVIVVAIAEQPSVIMLAVLIALFNVATRYRGRTALVAGVGTTIVFASLGAPMPAAFVGHGSPMNTLSDE